MTAALLRGRWYVSVRTRTPLIRCGAERPAFECHSEAGAVERSPGRHVCGVAGRRLQREGAPGRRPQRLRLPAARRALAYERPHDQGEMAVRHLLDAPLGLTVCCDGSRARQAKWPCGIAPASRRFRLIPALQRRVHNVFGQLDGRTWAGKAPLRVTNKSAEVECNHACNVHRGGTCAKWTCVAHTHTDSHTSPVPLLPHRTVLLPTPRSRSSHHSAHVPAHTHKALNQ